MIAPTSFNASAPRVTSALRPDRDTVDLLREWRRVFDAFPLLGSSTYHALRDYYRWPAMPTERSFYPARWETLDRIEGRDDPCRDLV